MDPPSVQCSSCRAPIEVSRDTELDDALCVTCGDMSAQNVCNLCCLYVAGNGVHICHDWYHAACLDFIKRNGGKPCMVCERLVFQDGSIQVEDKLWHRECFCCHMCHVVLQDCDDYFIDDNGIPFCHNDFVKHFGLECATCGEEISGEFVNIHGRKYHSGCFVCSVCKIDLHRERHYYFEGNYYCSKDWKSVGAPECAICGIRLLGDFITNYWGERYCSKHERVAFACNSCGRLVNTKTGGGIQRKDGGNICGLCHSSSATDDYDCTKALSDVADVLKKWSLQPSSGSHLPVKIRLACISTFRRHRDCPESTKRLGHTCLRTIEDIKTGEMKNVVDEIVVPQLSHDHLRSYLAGETGRIHLHLNGICDLSIRDGDIFCAIFEYIWLTSMPCKDSSYRLTILEDSIGGADTINQIKFLANLLQEKGLEVMTGFMKTFNTLPYDPELAQIG